MTLLLGLLLTLRLTHARADTVPLGLAELLRAAGSNFDVAVARSGLDAARADVLAADPAGPFDHACANPPYHPGGGTGSPVAARETAKRGGPGLLTAWTAALARRLRSGGSLSLVLSAGGVPEVVAPMEAAGIGGIALLALWPKPARAAKLVLLRGVKGGRGPFQLLPGLVLHGEAGGFTPAAEAVLREGAAL